MTERDRHPHLRANPESVTRIQRYAPRTLKSVQIADSLHFPRSRGTVIGTLR